MSQHRSIMAASVVAAVPYQQLDMDIKLPMKTAKKLGFAISD
jgi:hypothetical protein